MRSVLLAVALLAALAGCGEDEPPAADRERFAREADAICAALGRQTSELAARTFGDAGEPPSRSTREAYDREVAALQRARLAELRALTPARGDERTVAELLDTYERVVRRLAALPADEPGTADPDVARADALASELGLRACGGDA